MCRQLIYTCIAISSKEMMMKHETGLYVHVQERKREQERWGQAEKEETVKKNFRLSPVQYNSRNIFLRKYSRSQSLLMALRVKLQHC